MDAELLGDEPITLDYPYRERWLFEPFVDESWSGIDSQGKGTQSRGNAFGRNSTLQPRYLAMPLSAYFQVRLAMQRGCLTPLIQSVGNLLITGITFSNPGMDEH